MKERITNDLAANTVVLYMKGTPGNTNCGFSSRMVQILDHIGVNYVTRDVLASDDLRSGIKSYSGVKTLPQLFVGGAFAGGTDDIRELLDSGGIQAFFKERGVAISSEKLAQELVIDEVSRDEKIACARD